MRYRAYHTLLIICLVMVSTSLKAQLVETAIHHKQANLAARALASNDTISLPFWDDFTQGSSKLDTRLWHSYDQVFFNNGLGYLPPSLNVATLDAYDASGNSYSSNPDAIGVGDSLVSKKIDLSAYSITDNVVLSYFWQQGYDATSPDGEDSLRLYFKNDSNVWVLMKSFGGTGAITPLPFQQAFERLIDDRFFHAGFQFKFEYFGNLAGDFDIWNIDYVYLNRGNTTVSTTNFAYDSYEDRTLINLRGSILGDYYGAPLQHLTADWIQTNVSGAQLIYNNLWAGSGPSTLFATQIFGSLRNQFRANEFIDSLDVSGNFLTNAQDTALFTYEMRNQNALSDYIVDLQSEEDSVSLAVQLNLGNTDSLFFESINGSTVYYPEYTFQTNDTIVQTLSLHDYYAWDDGSAESSIQLNSKNYQIAQEFILNKGDYITAVDLYIPNKAQNAGSRNITLIVLESLNTTSTNDEVKAAQNILVRPSEGLNQFVRYEFETPVFVEDTIYVGYREENDEVISVGFDKNTNSAHNLYYNQSGEWERNSLLNGSIMLRPVFSGIEDILSEKAPQLEKALVVYPNPSRGILYLNQSAEHIQIFDLQGRKISLSESNSTKQENEALDISMLDNGLFIIQIQSGKTVKTARFVVQK